MAKTEIKEGDLFSSNNLCAKRPGTGISPMLWDQVVGKRAKRDFKVNEQITLNWKWKEYQFLRGLEQSMD